MLNIKNKAGEGMEAFLLFDSAKSCYVMARFCLEVSFSDFYVPGFLLMQQSLENFIKAFLKKSNIAWEIGSSGHKFKRLIELGKDINFFKLKILSREDFINLLKELEEGYNSQRYGESGHFIKNHEKMMDLFDELVYLFVAEFAVFVEQEKNEKLMALPMPFCVEKVFKRKLKQPFIFIDVLDLDLHKPI
jgi:HEPN domain-containing protein